MIRVIALTALAALGLSGAPVHEPVHGRSVRSLCSATERNMANNARPASARASSAVTDVLEMYSDLRVRRGELAVRWLPANVPRMTSPICRDLNGRSLLE